MKPARVALHHARHHLRVGNGADKEENCRDGNGLGLAGVNIANGNGFQPLFAMGFLNYCARAHFDVVGRFDLVYQVLGHTLFQVAAAHQDGHFAGIAGEKHGALPG